MHFNTWDQPYQQTVVKIGNNWKNLSGMEKLERRITNNVLQENASEIKGEGVQNGGKTSDNVRG